MKSKLYNLKAILLLIGILTFIVSCGSTNSNDGKVLEPSPDKRAREFADKGGGIFGDINNRKKGSTTFDFASSNILWRATLKSLEFLPLINADYSGGVIIYDWYSERNNPNEQIKVTVRFLDDELKANSIKIITHKKTCNSSGVCSNSSLDEKFSSSIQESILNSARIMKIEEAKKEKK
jgi:hypothetical protein